jgi:pimeloyl-ACP methyl ester carboxylesterase
MTFADVNGVRLYYEEHGHGFPVLLTHGYGSNAAAWTPQVPALSANHRLITWDARGHGRSASPSRPELYSDAHTIVDMSALLGLLDISQAVIGGLSMGGYMSMQFALAHPEKTAALIVCDTGPGYKNVAARREWNQSMTVRADALIEHGAAALGDSPEVTTVRQLHTSGQGLALAGRGMVVQHHRGVIGRLDQIEAPTLVLVGEHDEAFLNGINYIATHVPGAQKVVIPDAGHSSNIDNPAAFDAAVLEFLHRVLPRATTSR